MNLKIEHQNSMYLLMKPLIDKVLAFVLLIVTLPVFIGVLFFKVINREFPIFFKHPRIGLNEKIFNIYKFKTLNDVNAANEVSYTKGGKWLRKTSIDELPQLWNVLSGEMSLIGPRPLLVSYLQKYKPKDRNRHSVKPGITGLAQVNGRNYLEWKRRFSLDVHYVKNLSPYLDFLIFIKTIKLLMNPSQVKPDFNDQFEGA